MRPVARSETRAVRLCRLVIRRESLSRSLRTRAREDCSLYKSTAVIVPNGHGSLWTDLRATCPRLQSRSRPRTHRGTIFA
jgi:hypothetical protein